MIKKKSFYMLYFVVLINDNYDLYRFLYIYVWMNKKNL